ncbi:hypothetical protein ALO79_200131 [Pseudomonas syringae pv. castaneae]|uniref:Uncharacterized protein n=1 Tax=Pseudomonas syringae pv. castaneae TaxID=264450 RepID=A0A0P9SII1_PSESX|nr:hypothetical protein ALO79_200131 [Pseudomonas syringae pv. castaneae]
MRWVVITALGSLVEPEVKRNLAMLSGPVAAKARSASAPPSCTNRLAKLARERPAISPSTVINGTFAGNTALTARSNGAAWLTNTRPGCSKSQTCRSLAKSWDNKE